MDYCLVYTLGSSDSWRKIKGPDPNIFANYCENCELRSDQPAVSCDGALHWAIGNDAYDMVSFDLHNETFELTELPILMNNVRQIWFHHMAYKGCLCFVSLEEFVDGKCKVYLLIQKNKINRGWLHETIFVPFRCERDTHVVCFSDQIFLYWFYGDHFLFCNLENGVINTVKFPGDHFLKKKHRDALRRLDYYDYQLYTHVANSLCLRSLRSVESITMIKGI